MKAICSELAAGQEPPSLVCCRDSQAGRGAGKLQYEIKRGQQRASPGGCRSGEVVEQLTRSGACCVVG